MSKAVPELRTRGWSREFLRQDSGAAGLALLTGSGTGSGTGSTGSGSAASGAGLATTVTVAELDQRVKELDTDFRLLVTALVGMGFDGIPDELLDKYL